MFGRLNRVLQVGSLAAWLILVVMLWDRARALALGVLGAGALMAFLTVLTWRMQRRAEMEVQDGPQTDQRTAQVLVTQVLSQLTRTQVAYLGQSFGNAAQGRAWLKRTLPRGFRSALDEMHAALEATRKGEKAEGTRLALRLHTLRPQLQALDEALAAASKEHTDCDVAHPAIFVITEAAALDKETGEPAIATVAAWNPQRPTLIPAVDRLTIVTLDDGKRRVRGQLLFSNAVETKRLRRIAGDQKLYFASPTEEDDLDPRELPLGFVLSGSDLV